MFFEKVLVCIHVGLCEDECSSDHQQPEVFSQSQNLLRRTTPFNKGIIQHFYMVCLGTMVILGSGLRYLGPW